MPPKPIVNTEDILAAALSLVRTHGIENVNARNLAEVLGCSTKPLFRLFKNMDELKQELRLRIHQYCSEYLLLYFELHQEHIGFAMRYINFAQKEPNFFKAIFMNHEITNVSIANMRSDQDTVPLIKEISTDAEISMLEAQSVYQKMWLLSHGIASIVATNGNAFQLAEVQLILEDAYRGFILSAQSGGVGCHK